MKKVAFHTLGCKVNQYETEAMQQLFESHDYEVVPFKESAELYVINTCTVTNMADKKSRQVINKAKKNNPNAIIVVVGCYAQSAKEALEEDEHIDLVIGNNKKVDVLQIVEDYIQDQQKTSSVIDINQTAEYEALTIEKVSEKTRAYIKIQDGCNQFCAYCIIPYMRGRVRSRQLEDVVEEVKRLVDNGYKEIVLTGIHIASYGVDLEASINLLTLLTTLNGIEGLKRIRLGSIEPNLITEAFVKKIKTLDKICPHFHLSLQSGCDETLARMNRKYTIDTFYDKVMLLRRTYHHPSITTDIIVGFPGETPEEFEKTYAFLQKVAFSDMHIFKYSKREGTKAAQFKEQVSANVKNERSKTLIELAEMNKKQYEALFLNTQKEVLFEETIKIKNKQYMLGHTKEYLRVIVQTREDLSNQITKVQLQALEGDYIKGIQLND